MPAEQGLEVGGFGVVLGVARLGGHLVRQFLTGQGAVVQHGVVQPAEKTRHRGGLVAQQVLCGAGQLFPEIAVRDQGPHDAVERRSLGTGRCTTGLPRLCQRELRHKDAVSTMDDIAKGGFKPVIGEIDPIDGKKVTRVIFCSGKVYYDLLAARREKNITDIAIARRRSCIPSRRRLSRRKWPVPEGHRDRLVVEEPRNQGAWYWIASRQHLDRSFNSKQRLLWPRPASPSPAVGYYSKHNAQQKR